MKSLKFKIGKWLLTVGVLFYAEIASYAGNGGLFNGRDTTICAGKCLTLTTTKAGSCLWSTGATTSSITVCPTANQTVILYLTSGTSILLDSIRIKVDQHPVYPGDADESGMVTKTDVLKIGLAYGKTGPARNITGNTWDAAHAENWSKSFKGGINYKYADCNGDGKIDSSDLRAIHLNYSSSHSKTAEITDDGNPDLYYIPSKDSVSNGDTLTLHIMLGTETNPVNDIYSIAFTHLFNPWTIHDGSISLDVNPLNCWLFNNGGAVMSFFQPNYDMSSVDIAISRTDGTTVSGHGNIGDMVVIIDNVGSKRNPTGAVNLTATDITAISNDESNIPISTKSSKVYWKTITAGITPIINGTQVEVYPNPMSDKTLTIQFFGMKAEKVEFTDLLGNLVFAVEKPMSGQTVLNLPESLKQGVYMVRIKTVNGFIFKKIIVN